MVAEHYRHESCLIESHAITMNISTPGIKLEQLYRLFSTYINLTHQARPRTIWVGDIEVLLKEALDIVEALLDLMKKTNDLCNISSKYQELANALGSEAITNDLLERAVAILEQALSNAREIQDLCQSSQTSDLYCQCL